MTEKTKLELSWIGKYDERPSIEPRILIDNPNYSYGIIDSGRLHNGKQWKGNMIIHGDNLLALRALQTDYIGMVQCIYIDPPYNTGNAFEHYDDGVEHSIWLSLMRERLILLRSLLSSTGSIWIQIDDEEQAYLKVICDEIFGRRNFVNMISVNMKNIAGASGGGEDKRLKKNCEYILIYAKDYDELRTFEPAYKYSEISELVERYRKEGVSWKYTSVLWDSGDKEYIASTVDGDGNEIKIYARRNIVIKSIGQVAKERHISEKDVYYQYGKQIFRTTMPQSSIRPRVMEKLSQLGIKEQVISIEYVPKTGKNKGQIYTQFYSGEKFNLFAWLRDVLEERNGKLYKKDLQGTYWDFTAGTKNLTKEGNVEFPNGKKPESLISRIIHMTTKEGDIVLDSFLGSGTTAATAHKMKRRFIGVEMGEQAYSLCYPRLKAVIEGTDHGGITEEVLWQGGGGFKFYEIAPSLLKKDLHGNLIINKEYNADMLAAAMAKHQGFVYQPSQEVFWKQGYSSDNDYIYTTTQFMTVETLASIEENMREEESLLVCCKAFQPECKSFSSRISVKKIPSVLLDKCEFDHDDYSFNIIEIPRIEANNEPEGDVIESSSSENDSEMLLF